MLRRRHLGRISFAEANDLQRALLQANDDYVLLFEHPPTYTRGVRTQEENFLVPLDALDAVVVQVFVFFEEVGHVEERVALQAQVDTYDAHQRRRLAVKPGITGWAQVNGRASLPWQERSELDVWYVENRSLSLDAKILRRTVLVVAGGGGLYKGEHGGWQGEL